MPRQLLSILICFSIISCQSESKLSEKIQHPIIESPFNCQNLGKYSVEKSINDTANDFTISFPKNWDIDKVYESDLNGIFAMDTAAFLKEKSLITITINSSQLKLPLENLFLSEINGMEHDSIPIDFISTLTVDNLNSYFVLTSRLEDNTSYKDSFIYIKHPFKSNYLLITITCPEEDYKDEICNFEKIIKSIKFSEKSDFKSA